MSDSKGPWGSDDKNPWGSDDNVVKFEEKIKKSSNLPPINYEFKINFKYIVLILLLAWLASGFFQIQPDEKGVVLRFGKYNRTVNEGLNYRLPTPIEKIYKINVTKERSIDIGVRAASNSNRDAFQKTHMLTGDENIVDISFTVAWAIKDPNAYLFNMKNPDYTVKVAAQSAMREIVGQSDMLSIITGDRGKVELDTKLELQNILDNFGSGIRIIRVKLQKADPPREVVDAFNEVQRAKADMERFKNEAEAYRNDILPKAKGYAEKLTQSSLAYKETTINKAQGEADRFNSIYESYRQAKQVTIKRLYLETMEDVMAKSNKVIIDPSSKGSNPLPYLPLNNLSAKK
jgi:membrane protease subunit HflK